MFRLTLPTKLAELCPFDENPEQWFQLMRAAPSSWRALIRLFLRVAGENEKPLRPTCLPRTALTSLPKPERTAKGKRLCVDCADAPSPHNARLPLTSDTRTTSNALPTHTAPTAFAQFVVRISVIDSGRCFTWNVALENITRHFLREPSREWPTRISKLRKLPTRTIGDTAENRD